MRHYVAVQAENGLWFYANEGVHRETGEPGWIASGGCGRWRGCKACADQPYSAKINCEACGGSGVVEVTPCAGHATEAEAYEHHKQYELDHNLRLYDDLEDPKSLQKCEARGCQEFTSGMAYIGAYRHFNLCAKHRTREAVEGLFCVGESWES